MSWLPGRRRLVAAFLVLGLLPLILLTVVSVRSGGHAVSAKVKDSLQLSARLSALYVETELTGLGDVTESFARRPTLVGALKDPIRSERDRSYVRLSLAQLVGVRPGIGTAFVADGDGRLLDIVPATPAIVGKSFAYRDWYKGVTRTRRTYVSEAYRSLATGHPLVVAVATPVFAAGPRSRLLGILVAAYRLDQVERFASRIAGAEGVRVNVTDQRGVAIEHGSGRQSEGLVSRNDDPRVAAALAGRSGIEESRSSGHKTVAAYAPVGKIGWTVVAETDADKAYADVRHLNREVLVIAGGLTLLLVAGAMILSRVLRARQRAENETRAALREARRLTSINRALLDKTPLGIRLVDLSGNTLLENAPMLALTTETGAPTEGTFFDLAEQTAARVSDPDAYRAMVDAIVADPMLEGSFEFEAVASNRSFEIYTTPVEGPDGEPSSRLFLVRDVSAEREAERLKSELVATVSHELRTPLASIMGFAELLTEREYDAETRQRFLGMIRSESTRLTGLVNDFLDLQRIEEGRLTLSLEPFDLVELVREEVALFSGQSARHELVVDAPDETVSALGERARIAQVLANLLSNAIKYSPAGGSVSVDVELLGSRVRVSVVDHGLGIPAEQQNKIFSKFFRVDSSDTREIDGTGLGLALCRELVEAHSGRIGFESAEGSGSTFWFELPIAVAARRSGGPRVLIVEDELGAAELLRAYLAEGDYDFEVVPSGEDALRAARELRPDVVCLDMTLSGELDGFDVLARLKADPSTAEIPVVVCTAGNGRGRAAALGAADFLSKPFDARTLRRTVDRVLPDGRGSVLVVDDDAAVRALVSETLSGNGVELREAADGEEAAAKIDARRPDAIVLDLLMPGMNGFELLERLQATAETRMIPVIVLTGHRLSEEERETLRSGTVSLLEKNDYSRAELLALIERAVG